jgi:hypothetical protein
MMLAVQPRQITESWRLPEESLPNAQVSSSGCVEGDCAEGFAASGVLAASAAVRHHVCRVVDQFGLQSFDVVEIIPNHLRNFASWESVNEIHSFDEKKITVYFNTF